MPKLFVYVVSLSLTAGLFLVQPPPAGYLLTPSAVSNWGQLTVGDTITANGRGFVAGATYRIQFRAGSIIDLVTVVAGANGSFQAPVTMPDVAAGSYLVVACTAGSSSVCPVAAQATLVLTALPTTTAAPTTTIAPTTTTTLPVGVSTTSSTTTTTLPVAARTTTTTTTPPVGIETTTTGFDFGIPSTTLGGDPPPPPTTFPVAVTTVTSLPDEFAGEVPASIPNLTLSHIEVTQGLQNLANEFPLVEDRRTYVRIFGLTASDIEQTGVMAALEGVRDGESLGVIYAENNPVHFTDQLIRSNHAYSPYFRLPDDWAHGSLTLRGWIWANDPTAGNEPSQADNLAEVTVSFDDARSLHLYLYPLYLTEGFDPDGDPLIYQAAQGWFDQTLAVLRALPANYFQVHLPSTVVGDADSDWDLGEDGEPSGPLLALLELHEASGLGDNHHFVGMVDPSLADVMKFGGFGKGLGDPVVWVRMHAGYNAAFPWWHRGGGLMAHELGHNMGIAHAPCEFNVGDPLPGETAGGATDPFFPQAYGWPDCSLAPPDPEGFYGFDVYWETTAMPFPAIMSNNSSAFPPVEAFPFMGYKAPGWLDPWHGCQVLDFLSVECIQTDLIEIDDDTPGQGQGTPPTGSGGQTPFNCNLMESSFGDDFCNFAPTGPFDPLEAQVAEFDLVIAGSINIPGGTGELVSAFSYPERRESEAALIGDDVTTGPYLVTLRDATGQLLAATTLDLEEGAGHGGDMSGTEAFVTRLPALPGTASIQLVSPSGVLDELTPSSNPPVIEAISVTLGESDLGITWAAADSDGDELVAQVEYRADPTASWIPIGHRVTSGRLAVNAGTLPGGQAAAVRVLISDGFDTSAVISDPFLLDDRAPQALIFEPLNGQTRSAGRAVDFAGQALDPEDGFLEEISWSSDRDGLLGVGTQVTAFELSEGTHRVTLTVTDSAGNPAVAHTTVVVGPSDLPDEAVQAAVTAVFSGSVGDLSTTTLAAVEPQAPPGEGLRWLPLALGGIAVLAFTVLFWWRRRRRV